jgi:excisionase family DNA binding protein
MTLLRREAAERLGVTVTRVRQLEKEGKLGAYLVDGKHMVDAGDVSRQAALRQAKRVARAPSASRDEGEVQAAVFGLFDLGLTDAVQIVQRLHVPLASVDALFREWQRRDLRDRADDERQDARRREDERILAEEAARTERDNAMFWKSQVQIEKARATMLRPAPSSTPRGAK